MYYLVDIILCNEQAIYDVETLLGLLQVVARTTHDDVVTVVYEVADEVFEVEKLRTAIHERDVVHRKR